jgi:hypothetical protein
MDFKKLSRNPFVYVLLIGAPVADRHVADLDAHRAPSRSRRRRV